MERRKRKSVRKVKWGRLVVGVLVCGVVVCGVWRVASWIGGREETEETEEVREPLMNIVDENAGGSVSTRVKEFVVRLEDDLAYEGYKIARVVLPYQRTREVDVYLEGRVEYYKLSIDRGSAVSAEDMGRVARYLDDKGLEVQYVDIRVEGKAFYM